MKNGIKVGVIFAIIAALCSSINTPLSKLLLNTGSVGPVFSGGLLYLAAGIVAGVVLLGRLIIKPKQKEQPLVKKDWLFVVGVAFFNAIGVACTMLGLKMVSASNAALLSNFELIVTSLVALLIFKNKISPRLWVGISFIFVACVLLSSDDVTNFKFNYGTLLVLVGPLCWGFANNFMKKISGKDPATTILIDGFLSAAICIVISLCIGETITDVWAVLGMLGIGAIAYGVSLFFYIKAQRLIGAPRTSAYFSIAPFVAVIISLFIFQKWPAWWFYVALVIMAIGVWLASSDRSLFKQKKEKSTDKN